MTEPPTTGGPLSRQSPSPEHTDPESSAPGAITRLTHLVLAHKRIVVAFWLVLTLVGMASAGSATKSLKQKFSVPGKEGWVTNQRIARDFHGTGGNGAPLLAVVTLPTGASVASPSVRGELHAVEARLAQALPGTRLAGYASTTSSTFLSSDGHTTFVVAYPPPDPTQTFEDNPEAAKHATAALAGATVAGRAGPPDGLRRAVSPERWRQWARACCWRRCSEASERCWCWHSCSARSWRSCRS